MQQLGAKGKESSKVIVRNKGTHLRSFGREDQNNGAFQFPSRIAFDSLGNIVVPPPPRKKKKIVWV